MGDTRFDPAGNDGVMADVEVRNNESENRYEAYVDGELAGFAA
ncbi:MAG: hypothetical protein JWQ67_695, partial [Marmoricola sp.]|nr:hypothetical protein [Marmoricola sp.]